MYVLLLPPVKKAEATANTPVSQASPEQGCLSAHGFGVAPSTSGLEAASQVSSKEAASPPPGSLKSSGHLCLPSEADGSHASLLPPASCGCPHVSALFVATLCSSTQIGVAQRGPQGLTPSPATSPPVLTHRCAAWPGPSDSGVTKEAGQPRWRGLRGSDTNGRVAALSF